MQAAAYFIHFRIIVMRMDAICQDHDSDVLLTIKPQTGARETGVTDGFGRER